MTGAAACSKKERSDPERCYAGDVSESQAGSESGFLGEKRRGLRFQEFLRSGQLCVVDRTCFNFLSQSVRNCEGAASLDLVFHVAPRGPLFSLRPILTPRRAKGQETKANDSTVRNMYGIRLAGDFSALWRFR